MRTLVIAEHDGQLLRKAGVSSMTFAREIAEATGGTATWLVLGHNAQGVAEDAARYAPVLLVDSPTLQYPLAEPSAQAIAEVVKQKRFDLICAASTTVAKDILPRGVALLRGTMASDVIRHEIIDGDLVVDCPRYAGAVVATVKLHGSPKAVTVRSSAYPARTAGETMHEIERCNDVENALVCRVKYLGLKSKPSGRPDVTEARFVVSGGRAFKNSDDFEKYVGRLADVLGGAAGSSRALVDAGITPNDLQVGQTGKIVAPEIYIALGISGAVQHLAGMKNSRKIVAINNDADAPIFGVADYGMVGDVYEIVPQLIEQLEKHAANS